MPSILLVDDEPNYRVVLSELLRDEGYEVFTAEDGATGLDAVKNTDLDLVLTDMQMPKMDGMALLHEVKKYAPDLGYCYYRFCRGGKSRSCDAVWSL